MSSSILVRRVGNKIIRIDKYTLLILYVNSTLDRKSRTIYLTTKVYIVNNLKAKLLIGNDNITPKGIVVDLDRKVVKLGRY